MQPRYADAPFSGRTGSHQELTVWQVAVDLAVECYVRTAGFPWTERTRLVTRMRRAAASVVANIVEAHELRGSSASHRHLRVACGSVRELEAQFALAASLGYVDEEDSARVGELCSSARRMLEGLLRGPAGESVADRATADGAADAAPHAVPDAVIH